ncbi:hypothetical protein TraAM80_04263 [Trypanosoma rangeli]|uniref:Uncharacterized protein n=1 Tax=Trypanosoma rangeli TaxID=5698 RepID=A0A422NKD1_TRYRA|nr:uncharacterized protein TraAM80_04263 [Trypanosoma rangeli]RNF05884.1 hypothetical protein TraAM80_04263 [Trypanosoma rangeli]|eukprot:RNF05884.1 hypothetical protein TraAM80_04263 [Trypanosoma rangeli]
MQDEESGHLQMRTSNSMAGTTPKRHVAHAVRGGLSVSLVRPASAEKSMLRKRTSSVGSTGRTQSVTPGTNGGAARNKLAPFPPRSALVKNNSTNDNAFRSLTRKPLISPPINPKQVEGFLSRMREDETRYTKIHELVCESRGISFHPTKRSYSRASSHATEHSVGPPRGCIIRSCPSTPTRNLKSPMLRQYTGQSDEMQRFSSAPVNVKLSAACRKIFNGQSRAVSTAMEATPGARGGKRCGDGLATRPKEQAVGHRRPVISVTATKGVPENGTATTAHADRVVRRVKSIKRQPVSPQKQSSLDTPPICPPSWERQPNSRGASGAMSTKSISSHRMNCRTETAPYIELAVDERSKLCSPKKLVYEAADESPISVAE